MVRSADWKVSSICGDGDGGDGGDDGGSGMYCKNITIRIPCDQEMMMTILTM